MVDRLEVLFWGVRAMQRLQLLTVDRPSVELEWSGYTVESDTLANAQKHSNFSNNVKHIDLVRGPLLSLINTILYINRSLAYCMCTLFI